MHGETGEMVEVYDMLVQEIRAGQWQSEAEVRRYLRSDHSTYPSRMRYFADEAWAEAMAGAT